MGKENEILITFNSGPKVEIIGDVKKEYFIEFIDSRNNNVLYSTTINNGMWTQCNKKWYIPWIIKINGEVHHTFNLENQEVKISFESKSIGDTLAWAPQVIEFYKKYKCKVTVSTFHNEWFEKLNKYKDIKFIPPGLGGNFYAHYSLGWFMTEGKWDEGIHHLNQPNTIPLIQSATDTLGLPYKEINHGVDFKPSKRPIKEKYICIGPRSTAGLKEWPYEYWSKLAGLLNKEGYKVVNISYEGFNYENIINKEKLTWKDTYNYLHHADLFIGLGSGLSWFNWAMGKHTVMINNFIPYGYEMTLNTTKIEDYSVCNNCWVDKRYTFDKGKWDWCPKHQGTISQHICHKAITPEVVYKKVQYLLNI
jgi:autotransporter strand-loop-strand O-heptosyltransferase